MAAVKGLIFQGARVWLLKTHGEAGLEKFLSALPPEDRKLWEDSLILPISWLPARLYRSMFEVEQKIWGNGEFARAAASVALNDLSTVLKVMMKLSSVSTVANRLPSFWGHYFDTGSLTLVSNEPGKVTIAFDVAAQVYGEAGCQGAIGWVGAALQYAGAKNLQVEHPECAFKNASKCVLHYKFR